MEDKIQVICLELDDGTVARFTGGVQVEEQEIVNIRSFVIDSPKDDLALALEVTNNTLKKISESRLSDEQRKSMLEAALNLLQNS